MDNNGIFASPRTVTDLAECSFYHTMEIPGYGHVDGRFDLRGNESKYLGGVDLKGKRVLEVGCADGFLSFYMESQGADVVSIDLSEDQSWDLVPFADFEYQKVGVELARGIAKMNNSYWLCHNAFGSNAKVVYTSVYNIPDALGTFDVATLCATLVHFENPFRALQMATRRATETVVVTEVVGNKSFLSCLFGRFLSPSLVFLPEHRKYGKWDVEAAIDNLDHCLSWWLAPPNVVREFLRVLGFGKMRTSYHRPLYMGHKLLTYTIVAQRTAAMRS